MKVTMVASFDETVTHHEDREGHEGVRIFFDGKLRALRVLRGKVCCFLGCG